MDTGETFADLILRWSTAQGWDTNRLRLLLGLAFSTVKAWREGRCIPHELALPGLARALSLPEDVVRSAWERSRKALIPSQAIGRRSL